MAESEALSLGEVQRRFTQSLEVIETLKERLGDLADVKAATAISGVQLAEATSAVASAVGELTAFATVANEAISAFDEAMRAAGKVVQQTTLAELETNVADLASKFTEGVKDQHEQLAGLQGRIDELASEFTSALARQGEASQAIEDKVEKINSELMDAVNAANARAEAAEVSLSKIPEKYRKKFSA